MAKKVQNETEYVRHEDLKLKWHTANLKEQWEQATKDFQELWHSVHSVSRRYVEVEHEIRTAQSREERLKLIKERSELQVELEVLPMEAGAAAREQELALFRYFEAEERRLQKWDEALLAAEQRYYNPQTQVFEFPEAYNAELEEKQNAFKDWERGAKEAGIALVNRYGQPQGDWRNETFWEAHAYKRQDQVIRTAMRSRDDILNPPPPPYTAFQR